MRRIGVVVVLVIGAALLLAPPPLIGQRASRFDREIVNGREVVAGEVLVKFRYPLPAAELAQIAADADADDVRRVGRTGAMLVRSRAMNTAALWRGCRNRADVDYAEPNFIVRIGARAERSTVRSALGAPEHRPGRRLLPRRRRRGHRYGAGLGYHGRLDRARGRRDRTGIDYTHPDLARQHVVGARRRSR